ncbi:NAD(P)-binding protein [Stipitochalara longipes BDJ]|nr:NAD(P)-binding protein [Stipitochalara longipes BDJ]
MDHHTAPTVVKQCVLRNAGSFDALKLESVHVPQPSDFDVLVKIHAASLNYRDLMIAKKTYYSLVEDGHVPVHNSDFAGEVFDVGSKVTRFERGDRVAGCVHQTHIAGVLTEKDTAQALGAALDGGLVRIPHNLSFREGATLPCAALTAWNALYGGKPLRPGDTVLTLGMGGVSIFGVQFARVGGAEVISTTSSDDKAAVLRKLGARHVINYREDRDWGQTAKKLSNGGRGAEYVLEIGGPNTLEQSALAATMDGTIARIGTRGGNQSGIATLPHTSFANTRRIMIGSRMQFKEMNRAIEVNDIHPVIDQRVFGFQEAPEAFQYLWDQKAVGKVVIDICS